MRSVPDLADLSLEEKIGQMLCLGWRGDDALGQVNAHARECVQELGAGAMIVMGRNVQAQAPNPPPVDVAVVRAMLDALQDLAAIPLLLPTDQEGGRVARFRAPFTAFPAAGVVGRAGDLELARCAARITGEELRQVGVNVNLAPVADVHSNPDNPVIGERSFESDPERVGEFVAAQIAGFREVGILSCAKHFPGHGDTALDSHFDLPTVGENLVVLAARELVPFQAAIAAGVDLIMTAHILFPGADASGLPATMSPFLLTDLLRNALGFTGVIATDCLEMKAVADRWGTPRAAVRAAQAGADLLMICHTPERQRAAHKALLHAAQSGELPLDRLDDAAGRILDAKRRLTSPPPLDARRIGAPENVAVAAEIARKAGVGYAPSQTPTTLGAEAPV